jgi:hypothetical protein
MSEGSISGWARAAALAIGVAVVAQPLLAQPQKPLSIPPGKSAPLAKELAALLDAKKLTAYATEDPVTKGRYVAVRYTPGVELVMAEATYERPLDMDYYFYQKDYTTAYANLRSSTLSKDRLLVDDVSCDGLVGTPAKGAVADVVTIGESKQTFDGDFSDPRRPDKKKIPFADYEKTYHEADDKYAEALGQLIAALKK